MGKAYKIILLLAVAASFGFYAGILTQTDISSKFPWYAARASAIIAYLITFAIIAWGTGMTTGFIYKFTNPVKAWTIHKYMGIALGAAVFLHAFSLLFDKFINFGLLDVLMPFASDFKTFYLGLGIIAFYILAITIFVSILLRIRTPKFWRATHYFTYPFFVLALIHGVFTGTDSKAPAMEGIYWITGATFIALIVYRFFVDKAQQENR